MDFNTFCNSIISQLQEDIPEISSISVTQFLKNNDTVHDMLIIREKDVNLSPTICMNQFYDRLTDDNFNQIYSDIFNLYHEHRIEMNMDPSVFTDFQKASSNIIYRLINKEKNKELLKSIPHEDFLDLAITYCYIFSDVFTDYCGYIVVKNEHLDNWGIDYECLYEHASRNTPVLCPADLNSIEDTLTRLSDAIDYTPEEIGYGLSGLYVLTNLQGVNGSTTLLYKGLLKIIATALMDDLYLIPSSIHECLVSPKHCVDNPDNLKEIISIVNTTDVPACDVLSDNLYLYKRESDQLLIYEG